MNMDHNVNSDERRPGEFLLFALGFMGFLTGTGGVLVSSVLIAATGAVFLLFSVSSFGCCRGD
jgi:hypothetical protein